MRIYLYSGAALICIGISLLGYWLGWLSLLGLTPVRPPPELQERIPMLTGLLGGICAGLVAIGIYHLVLGFRRGIQEPIPEHPPQLDSRIMDILASFAEHSKQPPTQIILSRKPSGAASIKYKSIKSGIPTSSQIRSWISRNSTWLAGLGLISGCYILFSLVLGTFAPIAVVEGKSMIPTLNPGDVVILRGLVPGEPRIGQIIIFDPPDPYNRYYGSPIVHRVQGIEAIDSKVQYITKGDNNRDPDPWKLPAERIWGVYLAKVPYLGYLWILIRDPMVLGLIIVFGVLFQLEGHRMRSGLSWIRSRLKSKIHGRSGSGMGERIS